MIITFLLKGRIVTLNMLCRTRVWHTNIGDTKEEITNSKLQNALSMLGNEVFSNELMDRNVII